MKGGALGGRDVNLTRDITFCPEQESKTERERIPASRPTRVQSTRPFGTLHAGFRFGHGFQPGNGNGTATGAAYAVVTILHPGESLADFVELLFLTRPKFNRHLLGLHGIHARKPPDGGVECNRCRGASAAFQGRDEFGFGFEQVVFQVFQAVHGVFA